jgi:hypothetical protein
MPRLRVSLPRGPQLMTASCERFALSSNTNENDAYREHYSPGSKQRSTVIKVGRRQESQSSLMFVVAAIDESEGLRAGQLVQPGWVELLEERRERIIAEGLAPCRVLRWLPSLEWHTTPREC